MDKWLVRCANLAIVTIVGVLGLRPFVTKWLREPPALSIPKESLSLAGAETIGAASAKVAVIEFADFQCPYCAQAAQETVSVMRRDYVDTGKIRFAFRHLALSEIHPLAIRAGASAACAGRQHMFWKMHDTLFANQADLSDDRIRELGHSVGLDMAQFESCWNGDGPVQVAKDSALAAQLGVVSTPSFLIGAVRNDGLVSVRMAIAGSRPPAVFRTALDRLLGHDKTERP